MLEMRSMRRSCGVTSMLVALWAANAMAGGTDQLQCYRVKDPLQLIGLADLSPPQFAPSSGCTLSKAKLFCVPTTGTPGTIFDRSSNLPITPGLVSGLSEGDR